VAPLRLGFPSGAGDAEATTLQKNNFSHFFCPPMAIYSDVNGESGETCPRVEPAHHRLLQVMMLLTLLISRKMFFGGNLGIARVAGDGNERCVVGTGVGRCAWEAA
jgi:hypothetical protein